MGSSGVQASACPRRAERKKRRITLKRELRTVCPADGIVRSSSFSLFPQGGVQEAKNHAKARTPDRLPCRWDRPEFKLQLDSAGRSARTEEDTLKRELRTVCPADGIVRSSSFSLFPQGGVQEAKNHAKARTPDRLPCRWDRPEFKLAPAGRSARTESDTLVFGTKSRSIGTIRVINALDPVGRNAHAYIVPEVHHTTNGSVLILRFIQPK
jgi:hypothetical protein